MTTEPKPIAAQRMAELLACALQRRDEAQPLHLEELSGGSKEVLAELQKSLTLGTRLHSLHTSVGSGDNLLDVVLAGRYRLLQRLGAGSMGVVYEAIDQELDRRVAVKLLRTHLLSGENAELRFQREAKALASIRHPSIIAVHDRGKTEDGEQFLVMDLLEGINLAELVDEALAIGQRPASSSIDEVLSRMAIDSDAGAGTIALAVGWVADVADGLGEAHASNIFHRDVKPSNVMITRAGKAVLLDFGLAKEVGDASLTQVGSTLGTPAFLAPEAVRGGLPPGPALDVYGATATLYHLLTWKAPFRGTSSQVLAALLFKDPPRANRLHPGLPKDLQAILDMGMARRPEDRYATAGELAADLRSFLQHRPVRARHVSPVARTWRRVLRSPAARGGFAVAGLVALVALFGIWNSAHAASKLATSKEAWRPVPSNFGLGRNELRQLSDPEVYAHFEEVLDNAVTTSLEPVPARLVRAAFRLDHGDPSAATEDIRRIAQWRGTEYAQQLLLAYAALPPGADSALALDLSQLPPPVDPIDRYLAAFHLRRADPRADITSLLDDPELSDYPPAIELSMVTALRDIKDVRQKVGALELAYGGPTASSVGWMSAGLLLQKRYGDVVELVVEPLVDWPHVHTSIRNAARAHWMLGQLDRSVELYEQALRVKPRFLSDHELLCRVHIARGDFDQARATLEGAPFAPDPGGQARSASLLAEIEIEQALDLRHVNDVKGSVRAALYSVEAFGRASELRGRPVGIARAVIAHALVDDLVRETLLTNMRLLSTVSEIASVSHAAETSTGCLELYFNERLHTDVFSELLGLLEKEPMNYRRLEIAVEWAPATIDVDTTKRVAAVFSAIASNLRMAGKQPPPSEL